MAATRKRVKRKAAKPKKGAKKKSSAWMWVLLVFVAIVVGIVLLLLAAVAIIAIWFWIGGLSAPGPTIDSYGYASMGSGDYSISRSDMGEDCDYTISGTVHNPGDAPVSGAEVSCVVMKGYSDYGSGYAAGLSYGGGSHYIGTISAGNSEDFSFSFTGWKLDPSDSCYDYGVTCSADY